MTKEKRPTIRISPEDHKKLSWLKYIREETFKDIVSNAIRREYEEERKKHSHER